MHDPFSVKINTKTAGIYVTRIHSFIRKFRIG